MRLCALSELLRLPRRSPLHPELVRALAAANALHLFPSDLEPVPVQATSTTSQSGCYRFRRGDPIDLRISRRHDRVALSFLHELGHFVDHQLGHELGPAWASGHHEAFAGWREAARQLQIRLPAGVHARGAATSARRRSCGRGATRRRSSRSAAIPGCSRHLGRLIDADDAFVWPAAEFELVAHEVALTFAQLGLRLPAVVAA